MDILIPIGIVFSIAAILIGQALEGGHVGSILQFTAFLIVFGGTFGAVMVNYPMKPFLMAFKLAIGAVFPGKTDYEGFITQLENFAQVARKEGILALESRVKDVKDPFLGKGLQYVIENLADPSKLGGGIATAFVATVYGVGSANLLFLPLAGNIKIKIKSKTLIKELAIEGLIGIATGENPRLLREKLEGFIEKSNTKQAKK